jgi:hypothetical protein
MDLLILLLIFGLWLVVIVIVDSPWLTTRFRYWRITILALALLVYFLRGAISDLPRTRPVDFAIHHHAETAFGQSVTTIDISATTCRYYRKSTSSHPRSAPVDIACTITDSDLDALYAIVRSQRFDQIRFYGFPQVATASDSGGEFYITVTANGTTYRKDDPRGRLIVGGTDQWGAVEGAIERLMYLQVHPTPN